MARVQASLRLVVALVAAAAAVFGAASGASYTVGGPGGSWDLQTNLTAWASAIDFHPGDQLVFNYDASAHDVVEVSRSGYRSCSAASPVSGALRTGSDVVQLDAVGTRYFICGVPGHCDAGMKLQVRACNTLSAEATNGAPGVDGANGSPGGICVGEDDSPTTVVMTPGVNSSAPGSSANLSFLVLVAITIVSVLLGLMV